MTFASSRSYPPCEVGSSRATSHSNFVSNCICCNQRFLRIVKSGLIVFDQQFYDLSTIFGREVFTSPDVQIIDSFKHRPFFPRYFLRCYQGWLNYVHIEISLFVFGIHRFDMMQGYRNASFLFTQLKTDSVNGIDLSSSGSLSGSISPESTCMAVPTILPGLITTILDVELMKSSSAEPELKSVGRTVNL